ncbi:MAG: hypothetical protein RBT05_07550, partial [Bacteroidales bacterium]|nr:hypothetical protein [Bacteroidales bacterium]
MKSQKQRLRRKQRNKQARFQRSQFKITINNLMKDLWQKSKNQNNDLVSQTEGGNDEKVLTTEEELPKQ